MTVLAKKAQHKPKQARARATYDKLLRSAGVLLEEMGVENINTNAIVAHANLTPPTFYRYFNNKHSILEALGHKLMERQNKLIVILLDGMGEQDTFGIKSENIELLILETIRVTEEMPGGPWIMRSLRAIPNLANIRLDSHNEMSSAIAEWAVMASPEMNLDSAYRQARLAIEMSYAAMELLFDEPNLDSKAIARDTAIAIRGFSNLVK